MEINFNWGGNKRTRGENYSVLYDLMAKPNRFIGSNLIKLNCIYVF